MWALVCGGFVYVQGVIYATPIWYVVILVTVFYQFNSFNQNLQGQNLFMTEKFYWAIKLMAE